MGQFAAFMALCKAYCSINILVLPKQFDNGGWLVGVLAINISVTFVLLSVLKLVQAGTKLQEFTYPGIVEKAIGPKFKIVAEVFVAICQFSFTVTQISFTLKSVREVLNYANLLGDDGENMSLWWFAMILIALYSPLAWVRKLEFFSTGYIVGCVMILFTVLVVSGYCIKGLMSGGPLHKNNFYAVNPDTSKIWDMIGYSFYSFEGIGAVMPIMQATQSSVNFERQLIYSLVSLALIFSIFGALSFAYFGHMPESKPFVIQNLDETDWFINVTKVLFCINLVFSYPVAIFPTNKIFESYAFKHMQVNTPARKWLKNMSRTFMIFLACLLSITFKNTLDHFLGLSGAVLGIPVILIMPTLCH